MLNRIVAVITLAVSLVAIVASQPRVASANESTPLLSASDCWKTCEDCQKPCDQKPAGSQVTDCKRACSVNIAGCCSSIGRKPPSWLGCSCE